MSITAVTANIATGVSGTPFNHTVTGNSNRVVVIFVGVEAETQPTAVSYGGYSLVAGDIVASAENTDGVGNFQRMYRVADANIGAAGVKSVDVTAAEIHDVTVMELYDCSQTVPTGANLDSTTDGPAVATISSTATAQSECLMVSQTGQGFGSNTMTATGTGTWLTISERAGSGTSDQRVACRYQNFSGVAGAKTLTESWTPGDTRASQILASFEEDTGGATGKPNMTILLGTNC